MKRRELAERIEAVAARITSDDFTFDEALFVSDTLRGFAYEVENLEDYAPDNEDI